MPAASQMLRTVAQQSVVSGMGGHQLSSQMHPMMAQRSVTNAVIHSDRALAGTGLLCRTSHTALKLEWNQEWDQTNCLPSIFAPYLVHMESNRNLSLTHSHCQCEILSIILFPISVPFPFKLCLNKPLYCPTAE